MENLTGHNQGIFSITEWYDIIFEPLGSAYVAIEKTGNITKLIEKRNITTQRINKRGC